MYFQVLHLTTKILHENASIFFNLEFGQKPESIFTIVFLDSALSLPIKFQCFCMTVLIVFVGPFTFVPCRDSNSYEANNSPKAASTNKIGLLTKLL